MPLVHVGIPDGRALGREGQVEKPDAVVGRGGEGVDVAAQLVEPGGRLAVAREGIGLDRRDPGQRQLCRRSRIGLAGAAAAPGGTRRAERLHDKDLLVIVACGSAEALRPGKVAAVAEADLARELELCERKELGLGGYGRSLMLSCRRREVDGIGPAEGVAQRVAELRHRGGEGPVVADVDGAVAGAGAGAAAALVVGLAGEGRETPELWIATCSE